MYRVFPLESGYGVYWCPSAPYHFSDKVPYDGRVYSTKQAAYKRCKKLNETLEARKKKELVA